MNNLNGMRNTNVRTYGGNHGTSKMFLKKIGPNNYTIIIVESTHPHYTMTASNIPVGDWTTGLNNRNNIRRWNMLSLSNARSIIGGAAQRIQFGKKNNERIIPSVGRGASIPPSGRGAVYRRHYPPGPEGDAQRAHAIARRSHALHKAGIKKRMYPTRANKHKEKVRAHLSARQWEENLLNSVRPCLPGNRSCVPPSPSPRPLRRGAQRRTASAPNNSNNSSNSNSNNFRR